MACDVWFRFYNTALDHPKVVMLSDANFRAWVALLSLASKSGGVIPDNINLIARTIRKTPQKARDVLQVLLSAVLLDRVEGGYQPHNWGTKQFKSDVSTGRVQAFRKRQRNVSETVEVNARGNGPETETETETETEESLSSDPPPADADRRVADASVEEGSKPKGRVSYPEAFEAFWRDYPTDVIMSKKKTYEVWKRLGEEDRKAAHGAVPAFKDHCRKNPTYRPVHAERFLSQRRFDGLSQADAQPVDERGLRGAWGGRAALLVNEIGAGQFAAWFTGAVFEPGPPAVIRVEKPFAAKWANDHFGPALRRFYGEECRVEAAAA